MKSSDELKKKGCVVKKKWHQDLQCWAVAAGVALSAARTTLSVQLCTFCSSYWMSKGIMKTYFNICFRRSPKNYYYYVGNEGGDIYDDDDARKSDNFTWWNYAFLFMPICMMKMFKKKNDMSFDSDKWTFSCAKWCRVKIIFSQSVYHNIFKPLFWMSIQMQMCL